LKTALLLSAIAGVTLQKYAELVVKTRPAGHDRDACAAIAAGEGLDRKSWEAAMAGWGARLDADKPPGDLTAAYLRYYREAISRFGRAPASATFDAYVEMSAMIRTETDGARKRPTDVETMCAAFGIDAEKWAQISRYWVTKLMHDGALFVAYSDRVRARVQEMDEAFLRRLQA
jgi:hypothetical protein